jgi:CRP-like cAMP-binding protein
MIGPNQEMVKNHLLRNMAPADYGLLQLLLVATDLPQGMVLSEPGKPFSRACFPDSGIGSVVALSPEGHRSEVGITGRDGMLGFTLLLDVDQTPHETFMQVAGTGYFVEADALARACRTSLSLRTSLLRYVQAYSVQTSFTALSNATHTVEVRLARWLLMSHDRTEGDVIALTHEFIALMLGVTRSSVTLALHILEGAHLIRSMRGRMIIRDRTGLEQLAHDAYGSAEDEYERLIGPLRNSRSPRGRKEGSQRWVGHRR